MGRGIIYLPDWLRDPPSLLYNEYWIFRGQSGPNAVLTTHMFLVPGCERVGLYFLLSYLPAQACYWVTVTLTFRVITVLICCLSKNGSIYLFIYSSTLIDCWFCSMALSTTGLTLDSTVKFWTDWSTWLQRKMINCECWLALNATSSRLTLMLITARCYWCGPLRW